MCRYFFSDQTLVNVSCLHNNITYLWRHEKTVFTAAPIFCGLHSPYIMYLQLNRENILCTYLYLYRYYIIVYTKYSSSVCVFWYICVHTPPCSCYKALLLKTLNIITNISRTRIIGIEVGR